MDNFGFTFWKLIFFTLFSDFVPPSLYVCPSSPLYHCLQSFQTFSYTTSEPWNICPVLHWLALCSSLYLLLKTMFLYTPISSEDFNNFLLYCVVAGTTALTNTKAWQTPEKGPEANKAQLNIPWTLIDTSGPRLLPCFSVVLWAWPSS